MSIQHGTVAAIGSTPLRLRRAYCGARGTLQPPRRRSGRRRKGKWTAPVGAALCSYNSRRELKVEGSSVAEGLGLGRVTGNLEDISPEVAFQIPDEEANPIVFELLKPEGLGWFVRDRRGRRDPACLVLRSRRTMMTVLCDDRARCQPKLLNATLLRARGLPVPKWPERRSIVDRALDLSKRASTVSSKRSG
jgi:hypothetical protein